MAGIKKKKTLSGFDWVAQFLFLWFWFNSPQMEWVYFKCVLSASECSLHIPHKFMHWSLVALWWNWTRSGSLLEAGLHFLFYSNSKIGRSAFFSEYMGYITVFELVQETNIPNDILDPPKRIVSSGQEFNRICRIRIYLNLWDLLLKCQFQVFKNSSYIKVEAIPLF